MSALDDAPLVQPEDRSAWRAWLEANHAACKGVWLVTWRRASGRTGLDYEASIEEALCFGWVDGQGGRVDDERGKLYFAPRKPNSSWAATNKARVERLTEAGLMAPAGLAAVERAKSNGTWDVLAAADRLEVPPDLQVALDASPPATEHWASFTPSTRKMILGWIALAKRPETRATRIAETARRAALGEKVSDRPSRDR